MHGHLTLAFMILFDRNQNQRLKELMPVEMRRFRVLQLANLELLQPGSSFCFVYDGRVQIRVLNQTISLVDGIGEANSCLTLCEGGIPRLKRGCISHFAIFWFALFAVWL